MKTRIVDALHRANMPTWAERAGEECEKIIEQAKITCPLDVTAVDTQPPPVDKIPLARPQRGAAATQEDRSLRTMLLLGILMILIVVAIVAVGTIPTDTYEDK